MRRRIPHARPFCQDSFAHTSDILRCTMFNARSLNSKDKLLHLHALLYSRAFDIVLITETWLNNGTPSSLLDPDNRYNVIRCDRQHGQAGGVCAFVSKFLEVVEVPVTQRFPTLEICCFDVLFSCAKCRIFTAYDCASVEYMIQLLSPLKLLLLLSNCLNLNLLFSTSIVHLPPLVKLFLFLSFSLIFKHLSHILLLYLMDFLLLAILIFILMT
jgi:hypothetical protein